MGMHSKILQIVKIVNVFEKHYVFLLKLDSWVEVICDKQIQLSSIISAHAGAGTDKTAQTSHYTGGHFGCNRT